MYDCHIKPSPLKKMFCKLVLQIFSNSMYAAMCTCFKTSELKSSTVKNNVEFLKTINNLIV